MLDSELIKIKICVDSWIIQDGNYPDFHVGESLKCALEFCGDFRITEQRKRSMVHLEAHTYRVCAQVIFCQPNAWAIDFGLPAFQEHEPPAVASDGVWIEGEIGLCIDPFFYKDALAHQCGMPDLFLTSVITSITRDDAPLIRSSEGRFLMRDPDRPRWTNVQQYRSESHHVSIEPTEKSRRERVNDRSLEHASLQKRKH